MRIALMSKFITRPNKSLSDIIELNRKREKQEKHSLGYQIEGQFRSKDIPSRVIKPNEAHYLLINK